MSKITLTFPNSKQLAVDTIEENVSKAFGTNRRRVTAYILGEQTLDADEILDIIGDDISTVSVESDKVNRTITGLDTVENVSWTVSDTDPIGRTIIVLTKSTPATAVQDNNVPTGVDPE